MEHKGTAFIDTDRLILRKFTSDDAKSVFENWANDETVTKFLRWQPHGQLFVTQSVIKDWVERYRDRTFYQWAIVLKDTGKSIGSISAEVFCERTGKIHIGYCIGTKWWRKGYTSEALAAVIAFFFEQVGAMRIESQHDPENPNSGRVMRKCGMTYEGTLRKYDWSNMGRVDACMHSILREEYFANKQKHVNSEQ